MYFRQSRKLMLEDDTHKYMLVILKSVCYPLESICSFIVIRNVSVLFLVVPAVILQLLFMNFWIVTL